jgi:predicted permease
MSIVGVMALMGVFTLVGVFLRTMGWVKPTVSAKLNAIALNVTLPAGIFLALHRFTISRHSLLAPGIYALLSLAWWGLAAIVGRKLRLSPSRQAVFILTAVFTNTAFIGYPVTEAVLGEAGKARAVLIDQIAGEPLAFTLGAFIAARGAHESLRVPWHEELRRLLLFPPLLALAFAVIWQLVGWPPVPSPVGTVLSVLSTSTVPIVMVALGLIVRAGSLRESVRQATVLSVLRLFIAPLSAWAVTRALKLPAEEITVTTLEAGMPSMMFTLILTLRYGLDAEFCAALITATLLGSLIALPAWVAALT